MFPYIGPELIECLLGWERRGSSADNRSSSQSKALSPQRAYDHGTLSAKRPGGSGNSSVIVTTREFSWSSVVVSACSKLCCRMSALVYVSFKGIQDFF
jgi:hypothetical protein